MGIEGVYITDAIWKKIIKLMDLAPEHVATLIKEGEMSIFASHDATGKCIMDSNNRKFMLWFFVDPNDVKLSCNPSQDFSKRVDILLHVLANTIFVNSNYTNITYKFEVYHQTYDLSYPALALQEDEVFGYSGCFNLLQEFFTNPKYAKGANSSCSSTPSPKKRKIIPDNAEVFDLTK
jgi:hypothetical protein